MDRIQLQKLRDLPIEGVAERLGLRVVRHKALCPFHDDHHASLSFKVSKNTWHCFVCGASGGTIYNLPVLNLLKPRDELWITEGCSDCWAMLSAGHKAIAIPSATLLKRRDIELLRSLTERPDQPDHPPSNSPEGENQKASPRGGLEGVSFHMYPDRGAPGERLFMQLKEVLPQLVHHQLPPGCKDFSDYYLSVVATRH